MGKEPAARKSSTKPVAKRAAGPDDVAISYTVRSGDNLGMIASWYEVSVSDIKDWNGMSGSFLRAGQKLTLYVPGSKADDMKEITDMTFAEKQSRIGKENGTGQAEEQVAPSPEDSFVLYTVRSGDNLWSIAQKYPGVSHEDIMNERKDSLQKGIGRDAIGFHDDISLLVVFFPGPQ